MTISDEQVQRRTGFSSRLNMIAYIITICNGCPDRIRRRRTPLTWFEEWFLYFEWSYHQTCRRTVDLEAEWGINRRFLINVKDCKAALEMAALHSWPRFASYAEDMDLRKQSKWGRYDGYRPVMWDMTNISAQAFSDASLQRTTYSEYYSENCFKGGIFCQLCGWLGNEELWGGGGSDSDYNRKAGYLEAQEEFQKDDLVCGKIIPFLNLLDRGYRGKMAAWQTGRQQALQPPSSKSDQRFAGRQTLYAACIAHDRSGNERAVNICKRSGLMKCAFSPEMSATRFNYVWRCWGFRANFMYKPVI